MSKRTKYVPKHRHVPERTLVDAPKKALKSTVVRSSVAVAVTGVAVTGGVLGGSDGIAPAAGDLASTVDAPADTSARGGSLVDVDRAPAVSRSSARTATADPAKAAALSVDAGPAVAEKVELSAADPRDIARALLPDYGFSADQFGCLDSLWTKESGWRVDADNPTSSAYGIPQALTATHDLGADYMTNPVTQIEWGLGYIRDRYGSPCGAWGHSQASGWY